MSINEKDAARAAEPMPTMADIDHAMEVLIEAAFHDVYAHVGIDDADATFRGPAAKEALRSLFRRATGEGVGE